MKRALPVSDSGFSSSLIAVFALFPFYYAVITSFRSGTALFSVAYLPSGSICRIISPSSSASLSPATSSTPFSSPAASSLFRSSSASRPPMPSAAIASAAARCCS